MLRYGGYDGHTSAVVYWLAMMESESRLEGPSRKITELGLVGA